ncbi:MAG: VTT domain-containing protein [Armatimonadetes bacterium]|nr:VTT domain-containing protein [Armatimonadota bacterium]
MHLFEGENLIQLIKTVSYLGLFLIVFAESGLLIGFFLPGDSLLFTAGFLASQGYLNLYGLLAVIFTGAVLGDSVGYAFGRRVGPRIFKREDSRFFHKDHLRKAESFYEKHGGYTIIIARFMPIVRTFAPIVAGVGRMDYPTFLFYNVLGGAIWTLSMTVGGYFLGRLIPNVDKYLLPIIAVIVLLSVLPSAIHLLKSRNAGHAPSEEVVALEESVVEAKR